MTFLLVNEYNIGDILNCEFNLFRIMKYGRTDKAYSSITETEAI
jgi:hypothetical protein